MVSALVSSGHLGASILAKREGDFLSSNSLSVYIGLKNMGPPSKPVAKLPVRLDMLLSRGPYETNHLKLDRPMAIAMIGFDGTAIFDSKMNCTAVSCEVKR